MSYLAGQPVDLKYNLCSIANICFCLQVFTCVRLLPIECVITVLPPPSNPNFLQPQKGAS